MSDSGQGEALVHPAPDDARGLIEWARRRDPIGDRVHLALTALALFALPIGTTTFAIAFGVALGYSLLRLWATGPAVGYLLFRVPLVWVLMALVAWTSLSVLWSVDRSQAWDEIAILRFQVPALILFWPVIDRWRALVLALSIGAALAALIQVGQLALGDSWPLALWWHGERIAGRYPGMLHPSSTAVLALAAVFLLPHLARPRPSQWLPVLALWPAALLSLLLTGSRGCWIAALAGLIAATPQITLIMRGLRRARAARPRARRSDAAARRLRGMALAIMAIGIMAAAVLIGPIIAARVSSGVSGMRAAIEAKDYTSDVAARWRQIEISAALLRERPLTGVGAGGYLAAAREFVRTSRAQDGGVAGSGAAESGDRPRGTGLLPHPHSALLYYAAVLGLPGLVLFLALWLLLYRENRLAARAVETLATHTPALTALLVAFTLDSHNLSAPGTIALMLVVAIILHRRHGARPAGPVSPERASESCG